MAKRVTSKRNDRLQIMLSNEELEAIDNWRFDKRFPSRAAAIRELIRRGLLTNEFGEPETDGASSGEFGVVDKEMLENSGGD